MSVTSNCNEDYDRIDYWNGRYETEDEGDFEWCKDYSVIKPLITKYVRKSDSILMIGCGNSRLSIDMFEEGYTSITNVDFSPVVIEKMSAAYPQMNWVVMDMTDLTLPEKSFDIVIEKATLDVLFVKEKSPWSVSEVTSSRMTRTLAGITKVLQDSGKFLSITFAQPHFRNKFYKNHWSSCTYETFGTGFHYYFYISSNKCSSISSNENNNEGTTL